MASINNEPQETPLSVFLWGGEVKFRRRTEILRVFTANPVFSKSLTAVPSLARKDVWTQGVFQARELIAIKKKQNWSHAQFIEAVRMLDNSLPVLPQFRSKLGQQRKPATHTFGDVRGELTTDLLS
jgi:acyl-CoA oxidase